MGFAFVGTHTEPDWREWYRTNAEVNGGDVVVATNPLPGYVAPDRVGGDPQGFDAVDVAIDGCGMAYVLAADGDLYRYDPRQDRMTRLDCLWDPDEDGEPVAIAATAESLYIAHAGPGRVQAVSTHLLQTRWIADGFDEPVGLAVARGSVYVLDAGDPGSGPAPSGRLVRLEDGGATRTVVDGLADPIDVASDTAGNVYVLEDGPTIDLFVSDALETADGPEVSRVLRVPPAAFTVGPTGPSLTPSCLEAIDEGELVVGVGPGTPGEPTLYRYRPLDRSGGQSFERLPGYSGSSVALRTGRTSRGGEDPPLYVVGGDDRAVYRLDPVRQTRRNDATGRYDAQVLKRLDSGEPGTEWHRVTLAFELDEPRAGGRSRFGDSRTRVRLQYAATDDDWRPTEPDPEASPEAVEGIGSTYLGRLREAGVTELGEFAELTPGELAMVLGTERHSVPLHEAATLVDRARSTLGAGVDVSRIDWRDLDRPNPTDALLEGAEGRYLWVKLELVGTEVSSPRVDRFRAYFPRRSYLRYLPAVYREDERSAAFLERYLSLFESTFLDVEEGIGSVSKFLDPEGVPSEHLSWLGEWLAVEADDTWSAAATRRLLSRAPELYRKRGTAEGLLAMIRIYLGNAATPGGESRRATNGDDLSSGGTHGPVDRGAAGSTSSEATTGTAGSEVNTGASGAGEATGTGETTGTGGSNEATDGSEDDEQETGRTEPQSVYLLEHGDLSCIETPALGELYSRLISCPSGFLVLLTPDVGEAHLPTVERIVDTQQPAHATGRAVHLRPRLLLNGDGSDREAERGFHTYLGINSRLSDREFRLDEGGLGQDTMLVERESTGQLALQSRLGRDARID